MPSAGYGRFSSISELTAISPEKRANGMAYLLQGTRDWFVFDATSAETGDAVRRFAPDTGTGCWYRIGGTLGYQDSDAVTITGGTITGISPLAIAEGGTGAADAESARASLGISSPGYNYLVNGDFQSALAGTSFAASGRLIEMYQAFAASSSTVAITRQAFAVGQTSVPNEPSFFLRWVQSVAGTGRSELQASIEDVRTLAGQWFTLTFWARMDAANPTISVNILQNFGAGGTPSTATSLSIQDYTASSSWQKFTYAMQMPTLAGKVVGTTSNTSRLIIRWVFPLATTFTFEIADIKLEAGQVGTPFERLDDSFRIARYYQSLRLSARFFAAAASHIMDVPIPYQRMMRTTPTGTLTSGGNRVNLATSYPLIALLSNAGGRFAVAAAAAGECYALGDILVLDARF